MSISRTLINNPTIIHVTNNTQGVATSLKLLYDNICVDAYTKSGVYDDMKCYPGTRELILERLENWVAAPGNADRLITWLDGPMGAGKTAVAVTMAERTSANNKLIGSFIFRRGHRGRDDDTRFVATLAYQMALSIPLVRPFIEEKISYDPSIFQQSLSNQLDALILEPLRALRSRHPEIDVANLPNLIIVDGLDECGAEMEGGGRDGKRTEKGKEEQQLGVLELLHRLVLSEGTLPFAVLIHSRPEMYIKHWFSMGQHERITNRFTLDASYNPEDDIRLFATQGFLKLLETHPFRIHLRNSNWPHEVRVTNNWGYTMLVDAIERIVRRSEGQFLYAATVMRFISSIRHPPSERLLLVLHDNPRYENTPDSPHAAMDTLYIQILDSIHDRQTVRKILALHTFLSDPLKVSNIPLPRLLSLLSISKNELDHFLQQSESILTLWVKPFLRYRHSSLGEFLIDPTRSRHWTVDFEAHTCEFALRALKLFSIERYVGAQRSYLRLLGSLMESLLIHGNPRPTENIIEIPPAWSHHVFEELKKLFNFAESSYSSAVMRFITTSSLCSFLDTIFGFINQMARRGYPDKQRVHDSRHVTLVHLAGMLKRHIRALIKPHVKPYMTNPRSFSRFLCWVFCIPLSNSDDPAVNVPSTDSLPVDLRPLFCKIHSQKLAPTISWREWVLFTFCIPNFDFLCEAFIIVLRHAGRPSEMFRHRPSKGPGELIQYLQHLDLSERLWLSILDCEEYFTPYFRSLLHAAFHLAEVNSFSREVKKLYHQHRNPPTPVSPFHIALSRVCGCAQTVDTPTQECNLIFSKTQYYDATIIPSVPALSHYKIYCRRKVQLIPFVGAHCPCGYTCFEGQPDWLRAVS